MKPLFFTSIFSVLFSMGFLLAEEPGFDINAANGFTTVTSGQIEAAFSAAGTRGRLFFTPERTARAQKKIAEDAVWGAFYSVLEKNADEILTLSPAVRELTGIRLLPVSQEVLRRIFTLTFCAEMNPEKRAQYRDRACGELRAIARFDDWHPEHFLDTAEMTAAAAIGLDALREHLCAEDQDLIAGAIIEKGLLPSLQEKNRWWLTAPTNWNQVCHAGIALGALAVADRKPELAEKIIRRSVNGITFCMASYEPDGNYSEGPDYWSYGTSFNILLLTALSDTLGTDFGRSDSNGFFQTIHYFEEVFGPTGIAWNYSDTSILTIFEPAAFYFAEKTKDKALNYNEYRLLVNGFSLGTGADSPLQEFARHRLAPLAFLFDAGTIQTPLPEPDEKSFIGIGNGWTPIAVFRTGWDWNAAWFGIKGGSASAPHAHMDAGSFVYERYGYRWVSDLGSERYHRIESRGLNLWDGSQNGDRWRIYRYNNFAHSMPTVNGEKISAAGRVPMVKKEVSLGNDDSSASFDLTSIYTPSLQKATRTGTFHADGSIQIADTLTASAEKNASVTWRIITPAVPENDSAGTVRLSCGEGEKKASIRLIAQAEGIDQPVQWNWSEAKTENEWDSPNPGMTDLNFTIEVPAGQTVTMTVDFQ